jgi:hypothetical protein
LKYLKRALLLCAKNEITAGKKSAKIWMAQQRQNQSAVAERISVCCHIQLQMTA